MKRLNSSSFIKPKIRLWRKIRSPQPPGQTMLLDPRNYLPMRLFSRFDAYAALRFLSIWARFLRAKEDADSSLKTLPKYLHTKSWRANQLIKFKVILISSNNKASWRSEQIQMVWPYRRHSTFAYKMAYNSASDLVVIFPWSVTNFTFRFPKDTPELDLLSLIGPFTHNIAMFSRHLFCLCKPRKLKEYRYSPSSLQPEQWGELSNLKLRFLQYIQRPLKSIRSLNCHDAKFFFTRQLRS